MAKALCPICYSLAPFLEEEEHSPQNNEKLHYVLYGYKS